MLSFFPLLCMGQKNVNVDEAKKMMEKNKQLQIVDVRTPQEFASGHIEGAINIDWRDASFPDKIVKLKYESDIISSVCIEFLLRIGGYFIAVKKNPAAG